MGAEGVNEGSGGWGSMDGWTDARTRRKAVGDVEAGGTADLKEQFEMQSVLRIVVAVWTTKRGPENEPRRTILEGLRC